MRRLRFETGSVNAVLEPTPIEPIRRRHVD
jgi:hypothetical protein